ncbi:MAG TPA: DMT family transporter [Candidatus Sulfotelmatobacter sp.]|nr:DMT family transporter [Candidatus Sulfotelmatobacter sp.]
MSDRGLALKPYFALAGLALIWGSSFLFIKVAVHDMSPMVILLIRSATGCATLALIMRATGRRLFGEGWRGRIPSFALMAITNAVVPWIAIAWGEERISSGLASILNSTTTLWTAVLIFWVIPTERPSLINYAGVILGFCGVVILVIPDITAHGLTGDFFGAMAVVVASLSYAINAMYQRRKMRSVSVFELSLGQLVATVVFAIPLAAPTISQAHLSLESVAAVLALGAGGTGVAYLLYYFVMNSLGAVRAAGVTFLVPITAVFWGALLLHESVSWPILGGMVVILAGIVLTNLRRSAGRQPAAKTDPAAA